MWKSLSEFLPVFAFALTYEITNRNFFAATFILVSSTIALTFYTFIRYKRIPFLALIISLETTFFGFLTIHNRDPNFIQLRDTLYDLFLGLTILISALVFKTPIIKKFFGHIFTLEDKDWSTLSYIWGFALLTFAAGNEFVRLNFPPYIWVRYKFVVIVSTIILGLCIMLFFKKKIDEM